MNRNNHCKYYETAKWREVVWSIYRFFRYRIWDIPRDVKNEIKYFIQRGMRGWSDRDLWCLYGHLAKIIAEGTIELKLKGYSLPSTINPVTKEWDYDEKRWKEIQEKIIKGFAIALKVSVGEELEFLKGATKEQREDVNKIFKEGSISCRVVTEEEEKELEEAFDLLKLYFWNLAD